jgi:hypothetical protein
MKNSFLKRNGLSLALVALFLVFMIGQTYFGWLEYNSELRQHEQPGTTLSRYLTSGHFLEATAENWESEFLQMFAYVLLTVKLFQKGSSESKDPNESEAVDRDPRLSSRKKGVPGPVKRGGLALKLYENSLSIAFLALFLVSIVLHAIGGAIDYNAEQLEHGEKTVSVWEYSGTSRFWFESFQNWQSEFLALLAMVVLSIWLRQRGSPESKPVDAPHSQTGTD